MEEKIKNKILTAQKSEITEYFIYDKLSQMVKNPNNKEILKRISEEELRHYNIWKDYTGKEVKPDNFRTWRYCFISKIFGLTFGLKLMERGEENAQFLYDEISKTVPIAKSIVADEEEHEKELIDLLDEEKLKYIGSVVLGLSDALVELTGALAGFTLAFQNIKIIAVTGFITGIAAALSMAASEYLSTKAENGGKDPVKSSIYTGFAYFIAVLILIFPYFIFENIYFCLAFALFNAILLIFIFTFYISVAKDVSFKKRFFEMASITLGISVFTFILGYLMRIFFNVEI